MFLKIIEFESESCQYLNNRIMQRKIFSNIALLKILLIAAILPPAISFADADKIFKENSKAIVVIVTFDEKDNPISQGSGFIVRADGAIVTNYHVISNAVDIKVKAGDKVLDVEGLIYTDKENDLVILKAKGEKLQTVKLGDFEKANIGEKVYVISSPKGLENTISDGILSGIREITPDKKILQITAPISPGSSGGPVFNQSGEVIGIATFLIEGAQNLNFAIPVDLIKDKISGKKLTALKESELEDYKKTAEYWLYLGVAYLEAGKWNDAAEAYKQAIKINPDYAEAHLGLGGAYTGLGKSDDAIGAFKQAIRIKPHDAKTHFILGLAYRDLGMYKEAIEAHKQAIRIKPDYAEAYVDLGSVYAKSGDYRTAIDAYKEAVRLKPDYAEAHYNLGGAYGNLGMHREAIEAYKQAIKIKPDFAKAHLFLGLFYVIINDRDSALRQYKILKSLDPERANILFNVIYK